ncbi:MAG: SAM-dependent methyltransferase [Afipia sp.]
MTTPTIVHRSAAEGFSAKADNYVRGRPDYPDAIVGWLQDRLHLGPDKTVVDLGAGTGKFTAVLVKTGARVIAVEPIKEMREDRTYSCDGRDAGRHRDCNPIARPQRGHGDLRAILPLVRNESGFG